MCSVTCSANIEQIHLAATESLPRAGSVLGAGRQRGKEAVPTLYTYRGIEPDVSRDRP